MAVDDIVLKQSREQHKSLDLSGYHGEPFFLVFPSCGVLPFQKGDPLLLAIPVGPCLRKILLKEAAKILVVDPSVNFE